MSGPTLNNSYQLNGSAENTNVTTSAFSPAAGDLIVCKVVGAYHTDAYALSDSLDYLTWTLQTNANGGSFGDVSLIYTAPVSASQSDIECMIEQTAGESFGFSCLFEWWSGAQVGAGNVTATSDTTSMTTTSASSCITWVMCDENGKTGTPTYVNATNESYSQSSGNYGAYFATTSCTASQSYTFGMSAPSGILPLLAALELESYVLANQYATIQNAPWGIGTLTPVLINSQNVEWSSQYANGAPASSPCWIVWDNGNGTFTGVGWHETMPGYHGIAPAGTTAPQPTVS